MRYLSLFSGIGGFELGIQQAYDFANRHKEQGQTEMVLESVHQSSSKLLQGTPTCVGYSEIDKYAIQVYEKHFNHTNYGDIKEINEAELPEFDLLVGGFPCQSFSIAGKRGGFNDTRGTLFFDIARILKAKQPRLLLLENVKGLLSHDEGRTFATIISTLDELGYDLQWQVLNSKNFGVPQNRERVFIVGHIRGTPRPKVFPIGESNQNDIDQLNQPTHSNDRVYGTQGISPTLNTMQGCRRQPKIAPTMRANHHNTADVHFVAVPVLTPDRQNKRQNGRRFKEDGEPSSTLTAQDKHGIYDGMKIRRLTPMECERLQGFPDNWTEYGLSDTMAICANINPAIEKRLLQLDTVSSITSDGSGTVIQISQNECKEPVDIALEELLPEDIAISTINHGNAIATLFNQKGILLNATQLKESLTLEKMVEKSTCKLWKVSLVGHYEKEKLSTILTWINETMQSITSTSARIDENIIGAIILLNSQEQNYLNGESLYLRMGNIVSISDSQRYKCLGNAVTVNVIAEIMKLITKE